MKKKTFRGGTHPLHHLNSGKTFTEKKQTEKMPVPDEIVIAMSRVVGAPGKPIVQPGDKVYKGQLIAEASAFISSTYHSSVSGEVVAVEKRMHGTGEMREAVVIKNDHKDEIAPDTKPFDYKSLEPKEIIEIIKSMGVVGMGGATFPAHVKLSPPPDKKIDTLIINGAECEPYITCDHRLMLENPKDITCGIKIVMKALGVKNAVIGIEDNKTDAIECLTKYLSGEKNISVGPLKTKYPQGAEKQLIYSITKRAVPSGGLPMDIGVVVMNVGTVASVAKIFETGLPVTERIVSVTGSGVKDPKNLIVRLGTSFEDCVKYCGGLSDDVVKVISGGPMMGVAQNTLGATINEGTTGILALTFDEAKTDEPQNCIRCGSCVVGCPIGLMPLKIAAAADNAKFDMAEKLGAMDCIECGTCSYICPARRSLVQSIRLAKSVLRNKSRIR